MSSSWSADSARRTISPPRMSAIQYAWRSPTLDIQAQIASILERNAHHAAAATGCRGSVRWITKTRVGLPNRALADLTYGNLVLVGPPVLGEEARRFGREIQKNLGIEPMDDPFMERAQRLTSPEEYEAFMRT